VRGMTADDVVTLTQASASFRNFHDQIVEAHAYICGNADCW